MGIYMKFINSSRFNIIIIYGLRTYQAKQYFEPECVQVHAPVLLLQVDEPPAALEVPRIFPHGLDALFKD